VNSTGTTRLNPEKRAHELAGTGLPVPAGKGVGGSNPPCSTN